jgi:hypothetical protein
MRPKGSKGAIFGQVRQSVRAGLRLWSLEFRASCPARCAPQRGRRIHRAPRTPPGLLDKAYGCAAFVKTTACSLQIPKYFGIGVFVYARAFLCLCAGVLVCVCMLGCLLVYLYVRTYGCSYVCSFFLYMYGCVFACLCDCVLVC